MHQYVVVQLAKLSIVFQETNKAAAPEFRVAGNLHRVLSDTPNLGPRNDACSVHPCLRLSALLLVRYCIAPREQWRSSISIDMAIQII